MQVPTRQAMTRKTPSEKEFVIVKAIASCLALLFLLTCPVMIAADDNNEEEEERELGLILDDVRATLAFTSGTTRDRDYQDLRIYLSGEAHYALDNTDYMDIYLLINRLDRSWDDRDDSDAIRNIFNCNLSYVLGGVDPDQFGLDPFIGLSLFGDEFLTNLNAGLGYGYLHNYRGGNLRGMAGLGRNIGYSDDWSPLVTLGWTHNERLGDQWRLRTRADIFWNEGRSAAAPDDGRPDTILVLDGTLTYDVARGWSLYTRYFNDNASDRSRSLISFGLSHRYRRPRPRR